MAQQSQSKKYVTLDDVRVSYDPKLDLIRLTSGDEELTGRGGLKVDLHNMSEGYRALREVLIDHGVIRDEPWAKISAEGWLKLEASVGKHEILIGANLNGEPISWDIRSAPHLWLYSAFGSGSTFVTRSILSQLLKKQWEFVVLELDSREHFDLWRRGVLADQSFSATGVVQNFLSVMRERYESLEAQEVNSYKDSAVPMEPLVLYVEDLAPIFGWARSKDQDQRDFARGILDGLVEIARLGRAVDIHLVLQTNVGSTDRAQADGELMREIFDTQVATFNYVAMGRFPQSVLPKILQREKPLNLRGAPGRGTFISYGARNGFAAAHIPADEYRDRLDQYLPII